ncbi:MAG: methylmalonyl-CoA mutase family protein, partial [Alphaproteobacteria bacterium]
MRAFAVIALDPTRQKSGGALLGDRLRMNFAADPRVFMRSMATRRRDLATNEVLGDCVDFLKSLGFDLIIIETAGAGQGGTELVGLADVSLYVMTSDYGGPTQLEKIQMLDYADLIALNKCDAREAEDALRDVRKQWRRNRNAFTLPDAQVPVYPTVASRVHDAGVAHLFYALCEQLERIRSRDREPWTPLAGVRAAARGTQALIPPRRSRYLGEIAEQGLAATAAIERQVRAASQAHGYYTGLQALADPQLPPPLKPYSGDPAEIGGDDALVRLRRCYQEALALLSPEALAALEEWPQARAQAQQERYAYRVRGREITGDNATESLSHLRIPRLALPHYQDWGSLLRFLLKENLPGRYPYT